MQSFDYRTNNPYYGHTEFFNNDYLPFSHFSCNKNNLQDSRRLRNFVKRGNFNDYYCYQRKDMYNCRSMFSERRKYQQSDEDTTSIPVVRNVSKSSQPNIINNNNKKKESEVVNEDKKKKEDLNLKQIQPKEGAMKLWISSESDNDNNNKVTVLSDPNSNNDDSHSSVIPSDNTRNSSVEDGTTSDTKINRSPPVNRRRTKRLLNKKQDGIVSDGSDEQKTCKSKNSKDNRALSHFRKPLVNRCFTDSYYNYEPSSYYPYNYNLRPNSFYNDYWYNYDRYNRRQQSRRKLNVEKMETRSNEKNNNQKLMDNFDNANEDNQRRTKNQLDEPKWLCFTRKQRKFSYNQAPPFCYGVYNDYRRKFENHSTRFCYDNNQYEKRFKNRDDNHQLYPYRDNYQFHSVLYNGTTTNNENIEQHPISDLKNWNLVSVPLTHSRIIDSKKSLGKEKVIQTNRTLRAMAPPFYQQTVHSNVDAPPSFNTSTNNYHNTIQTQANINHSSATTTYPIETSNILDRQQFYYPNVSNNRFYSYPYENNGTVYFDNYQYPIVNRPTDINTIPEKTIEQQESTFDNSYYHENTYGYYLMNPTALSTITTQTGSNDANGETIQDYETRVINVTDNRQDLTYPLEISLKTNKYVSIDKTSGECVQEDIQKTYECPISTVKSQQQYKHYQQQDKTSQPLLSLQQSNPNVHVPLSFNKSKNNPTVQQIFMNQLTQQQQIPIVTLDVTNTFKNNPLLLSPWHQRLLFNAAYTAAFQNLSITNSIYSPKPQTTISNVFSPQKKQPTEE
ncbi:unnamed protein product [Didymodactylos carnosus]|uniref:Uncharacterized protein n=1 Tax=Didymodactylos carnosus TaxID=1234261 RepID=A0A813TJW1_9BILA|nr:unnamed protein product [Didymodactylos carnosus]CAF1170435.1 unnamed protein product [Didymodactylos carnosus]CAF3599555.1 unnamed protein product [Didymodactylos carnosus]CAF3981778.1 unnamed protein product [Didymodactylos carnosus]